MPSDSVVAELAKLYELTGRLREECPWDRKQTQESIVPYTVEEVYELVDAIAERGARGEEPVCGELGDLMYQVFFLARVAEERGDYDLADVAAGISEKLIRRHPHIFAESRADTPEAVRESWDAIKRDSEGREGIFHDVPESFPALLLAQKLQQRAAAVGFDWRKPQEVMAKVHEESAEVEEEMARGVPSDALSDEVGDLLFAVVNLGRKLKVDPEVALRRAALRFKDRVQMAEAWASEDGVEFRSLSLEEQEAYYQRAKKERGG